MAYRFAMFQRPTRTGNRWPRGAGHSRAMLDEAVDCEVGLAEDFLGGGISTV